MHSSLFDALTAEEISQVSALIRKAGIAGDRPGFGSMFTHEPDKAKVRTGESVSRQARALVLDRTSAATYDVIVDVDRQEIASATRLTDGSAQMLAEEI